MIKLDFLLCPKCGGSISRVAGQIIENKNRVGIMRIQQVGILWWSCGCGFYGFYNTYTRKWTDMKAGPKKNT